MRLLVEPSGQVREPDGDERLGDAGVVQRVGFRRIAHRGGERAHREIGPLWQQHHLGVFRHRHATRAERPDAGERAKQRRLAGP
jgi:hypothetical protein